MVNDSGTNPNNLSMDKVYQPLNVLGEGTFGKLYLMRHTITQRLVCVKALKLANRTVAERQYCAREAKLMSQLYHPNIIGTVKLVTSASGQRSINRGLGLSESSHVLGQRRLKSIRRPILEAKILNWFCQLSLGLQYLHANKVIHRDIKPANVFLLGDGRIILGDLGVSRQLDETKALCETQVGTPYSMSPEVIQHQPYSFTSDVYSLGVVLYHLCSGQSPFPEAKTSSALFECVLSQRAPVIPAWYSPQLTDLVAKMLEKDPSRRPQMGDIIRKGLFRRALQDYLADAVAYQALERRNAEQLTLPSPLLLQSSARHTLQAAIEVLLRQFTSLGLLMDPPDLFAEPAGLSSAIVHESGRTVGVDHDRKRLVEETLAELRQERTERRRQRQAEVMIPLEQVETKRHTMFDTDIHGSRFGRTESASSTYNQVFGGLTQSSPEAHGMAQRPTFPSAEVFHADADTAGHSIMTGFASERTSDMPVKRDCEMSNVEEKAHTGNDNDLLPLSTCGLRSREIGHTQEVQEVEELQTTQDRGKNLPDPILPVAMLRTHGTVSPQSYTV